MTIIDSQVHAYEANTPKRPWDTVPNWPDHVTGDEMVAGSGMSGRLAMSFPRHGRTCFGHPRLLVVQL